jgi:hypothetical protein
MFQKLDMFPSSGEGETPTLLGPLEGANLNHWTRMETDPVSKTLCSLDFRIPDNGQSPKSQ